MSRPASGSASRPASGSAFVFNVAGLLGEPAGSTRDLRIAGATLALDDDLRLSEPIEGRLRLTRTNRGLIVSARLATSIEATCARCLRPIEVPLTLEIDDEALPSLDIATGQAVDVAAEPDALRMTDHHELDFGPSVRAEISLQEPIAPHCRPDCPGLCPTCGEPLEIGEHGHAEDDIDPRLAALRAFRVADDGAGPAAQPEPADQRRSGRST